MKIFVGSSKEGIPQVKELVNQLLDADFEVSAWYRDAFDSGKSYLESLQEWSEKVDFAVIVLRPEDEKVQRGVKTSSARDNCIFEAGLFIGALKRDRVFLVSNLKNEELPSDLLGIKLIDGEKKADRIARDIGRQATEPYQRADPRVTPLTYAELLDRESKLSNDGRVVVQSGQPIELEATNAAKDVRGVIAERVRNNMKERTVYYHYFFYADPDTVDNIALLCSRIATLSETGQVLPHDEIKKNLQLMRSRLRIHLMQKQPLLDFCIHDLMSDRPRLYLRNRDREIFYLWSEGRSALEFARDVRAEVRDAWDRQVIFSATGLYDFNGNPEYKERLKKRCLAFFEGECQATAADYLFGPP